MTMNLIQILITNYLENVSLRKVKVLNLINFNSDGNMLLFGTRQHWLAKKEFKKSLFSLKTVTCLLL